MKTVNVCCIALFLWVGVLSICSALPTKQQSSPSQDAEDLFKNNPLFGILRQMPLFSGSQSGTSQDVVQDLITRNPLIGQILRQIPVPGFSGSKKQDAVEQLFRKFNLFNYPYQYRQGSWYRRYFPKEKKADKESVSNEAEMQAFWETLLSKQILLCSLFFNFNNYYKIMSMNAIQISNMLIQACIYTES